MERRPSAEARMAIAHEWLAVRAGSEKTFEAMAEAFPRADLYALTRDPEAAFYFGGREVVTTALDRWPLLRDRRALALPLMPAAWRFIPVRESYDVVLTSSHAFVRTFPPARPAQHFCYCHAPMRYAWSPGIDQRTSRQIPGLSTALAGLRAWDRRTTRHVDHFAANSSAVRDRIGKFYGREATVIHPPVDTGFFTPSPEPAFRERALAVSRFIPYKRLDLAIRACAQAGVPLTLAGSGPDEADLRALARTTGADVEFEIAPSDERLRDLYRTSIALLFPANEDFGIVPVETQACGTPVIGLDEGGVRDTVIHGETGLRVARQEPDDFADALRELVGTPPKPQDCREHAERFSLGRFIERMQEWILART